jgi:putative ABC transport system permease protein
MFLRDVIRRSSRSLRSAKMRTILTSLAIAVGGFTLTLTLAAGNGIRDYTDRLVATNFDPAELIVGRDKEVSNSGTPNAEPKEYDESISSLTIGGNGSSLQVKQVTDKDVEQLKQLPYVEQVRKNYQLNVRYITREGQKQYTLSAEAYAPSQKPEVDAGKLPESGDLKTGTITIPNNYLKPLGFENANDAVGKTVQINYQQSAASSSVDATVAAIRNGVDPATLQPPTTTESYKIVAVTKKAATSINFGTLPVLFSSTDAKEIYDYTTKGSPNYGKYVYVFVRVKDGSNPENLAAAQSDLKDRGYFTQSSKDIQQSITQIVNILQALVGVFAIITLIASIFGIVNTQYISVLERTREIGLMKALGMRKKDIGRLFRFEAAWIGFLGGVIGAVMALAVGIPLNPWVSKKLDLGEGNYLLVFQPLQIIALIVILVVIAMIAGYLPSRKAARLDPIEALRTE